MLKVKLKVKYQDCIFIVSGIINYQLRIRMGSNQLKLIKT